MNFQENYNKLLTEKTSIVKDAEAVRHLVAKLDQLYDGLWTSLDEKKNEAINERRLLLSCGDLDQCEKSAAEVGRQLLQTELNLWTGLVFGVWCVVSAAEGGQADLPTEYMQLGIPPEKEPIIGTQEDFRSNRLEYYCQQVVRCWAELP